METPDFEKPRVLTADERAEMERLTLEMHAEAKRLLANRNPKFAIRALATKEDGK